MFYEKSILLFPFLFLVLASCSNNNTNSESNNTKLNVKFEHYVTSWDEVPFKDIESINTEFNVSVNNEKVQSSYITNSTYRLDKGYVLTELAPNYYDTLINTDKIVERNNKYEIKIESTSSYYELYSVDFYGLKNVNDSYAKEKINAEYSGSEDNKTINISINDNEAYSGYYFEVQAAYLVEKANYGSMFNVGSLWFVE